jgi:D-lactate dehydrogenase
VAEAADRSASDHAYVDHVREIDADTPARFNADPARLFEASGSAGKVMSLPCGSTRSRRSETRVFYIGTNDPAELTALRRAILGSFANLPVAGEYMHRHVSTLPHAMARTPSTPSRPRHGSHPRLFAAKARVDGLSFLPAG